MDTWWRRQVDGESRREQKMAAAEREATEGAEEATEAIEAVEATEETEAMESADLEAAEATEATEMARAADLEAEQSQQKASAKFRGVDKDLRYERLKQAGG